MNNDNTNNLNDFDEDGFLNEIDDFSEIEFDDEVDFDEMIEDFVKEEEKAKEISDTVKNTKVKPLTKIMKEINGEVDLSEVEIDYSFTPTAHDSTDLFMALRNNSFKSISFAFDLENNKFCSISHIDMTRKTYIGTAFLAKLSAAYENSFGAKNTWLTGLSLAGEKTAIQTLKYSLPAVEAFTAFPNKPTGVTNIDGFEVFNHFNHNKKLVEMRNKSKTQTPIKKIEDMNWAKYREIEFLFRFLTNEQENPAMDFNSTTNKYDIKVSVFEKFVHYLSAMFNRTEKLGVAWTFYSPVQGVGKDVLLDFILKPIIGTDFVTGINQNTVLGSFNAEIDGKLLCVFNECQISNPKDKVTFNNVFKDWVTNREIMIHEKNKKNQYKMNFSNFFIFTNAEAMFHIEKNCRRNIIIKTPPCRLVSAVKTHLGMDIEDFIQKLEETRDDFYLDILSFEYDLKFIKLNAPMTPAKENVIRITNTLIDILAEYVISNEQENLKAFLEDKAELSPEDVFDICLQVNKGFLKKESADLLTAACKAEEWEEMKPAAKNKVVDGKFGGGKRDRLRFKNEKGVDSEKKGYKFANFSQDAFENYMNGNFDVEVRDVEAGSYNITGFSF